LDGNASNVEVPFGLGSRHIAAAQQRLFHLLQTLSPLWCRRVL
jgi:hypothetical protein